MGLRSDLEEYLFELEEVQGGAQAAAKGDGGQQEIVTLEQIIRRLNQIVQDDITYGND